MEESQPSPSPQREVLIIPFHPNAAASGPTQQTSGLAPPQATPTPTVTAQQAPPTDTASSPKTTPNATVSSARGPGSQLFAELLESHARRNPRPASPEPPALASPVAAPQSLSLTPTSSPQRPGAPTQGSQLFAELLESHARRNPRPASPEPAALPSMPSPVATPQSLPLTPTSSPQQPGSQLFAELLESHARRNPRPASPEPAASPSRDATPSPVATPQSLSLTPSSSPQQPGAPTQGGLSLGSPELLKELKQPHSLKHVSAHKGLTTVFSGRGRNPSASTAASVDGQKPQRLSNGTQR